MSNENIVHGNSSNVPIVRLVEKKNHQIPQWIAAVMISAIAGLMLVIWTATSTRIDKLEDRHDQLLKQLADYHRESSIFSRVLEERTLEIRKEIMELKKFIQGRDK